MTSESIIFTLPQGQFTPLQDLTVQGLISAFLNLILIIAAVLFVFSLLIGAVKLIASGGNKDSVENAKRQLIDAFLGVFIVFSSWALLNVISVFFGIDLLTFEIPTL